MKQVWGLRPCSAVVSPVINEAFTLARAATLSFWWPSSLINSSSLVQAASQGSWHFPSKVLSLTRFDVMTVLAGSRCSGEGCRTSKKGRRCRLTAAAPWCTEGSHSNSRADTHTDLLQNKIVLSVAWGGKSLFIRSLFIRKFNYLITIYFTKFFYKIKNSLCFSTWELKSLPNAVDLWSIIIAMELPSPHVPSLFRTLLILNKLKDPFNSKLKF